MVKETFIIRTEWWDAIELLNDEEKANILNNLFGFHMGNCEKLGFISKNVELVWKLLLPNLKFNQEKYDKRRETSAINGVKGGRPTEKQKPKKPTSKPNKPIETLSVFVTDTDTVSDTDLNTNTFLSESIKGEPPKIQKVKTEFETAFDDFLDMRKKIRKPATEKAKDLIFKKLEQFAPNNEIEQIKILEQSTLNCWQDVYQLKNKNQNNDTRTNNGTNTKPELIGGIPKSEVEKLLSRFDRANS